MGQSCIAALKDLKSSNSYPIYMALTTGTGGDDEERDMVMAIDQWQTDEEFQPAPAASAASHQPHLLKVIKHSTFEYSSIHVLGFTKSQTWRVCPYGPPYFCLILDWSIGC